jgi:hypothetical protein
MMITIVITKQNNYNESYCDNDNDDGDNDNNDFLAVIKNRQIKTCKSFSIPANASISSKNIRDGAAARALLKRVCM